MANPLHDIQRALSSLAILPDIGRHIARMARDVKTMSQAVVELGPRIDELNESVEALHRDMKSMVDDVAELKTITHHIEDLSASVNRLPFVRRKPVPAPEPPEAA
jgi:hypothetical protein